MGINVALLSCLTGGVKEYIKEARRGSPPGLKGEILGRSLWDRISSINQEKGTAREKGHGFGVKSGIRGTVRCGIINGRRM